MIDYKTVIEDLQNLRDKLTGVNTTYAQDQRHIGRAISYLALLEDIVKSKQSDDLNSKD